MSHNFSSAASGEQFNSRFFASLKMNIVDKCSEWTSLIQEMLNVNTKELQNFYPVMVEDLFAFGSQSNSNINLKCISSQTHLTEFNSLYNLMHPDGPIFKMIRHLMCDNLFRCPFPMSCLSMPTRALIESGIVPNFFISRLSSNGAYFPNQILLNPFEFFLFHFCYHIHNCSKSSMNMVQANFNPSFMLYTVLVETYLLFFAPIELNKIKPNQPSSQEATSHSPVSLWQSLSSTTSILFNLNTAQNPSSPTFSKPSLLNLKALMNQSVDFQANNPVAYPAIIDPLNSSFRFENILNIFIEMWLNVKTSSHIMKKLQSSTHLHSSFIQNPDHMRCVRILVKHFHYFANSLLLKKSLINPALFENTELDEIKRNIWSDKFLLQSKLYTFLRVAFEKWPLDSSFRLPLEIWLSFIQPWRYLDPTFASKLNEDQIDLENKDGTRQDGPVDKSWKSFISNNILFYSVIFRQLIPRFLRLDLSTSKNAFMLFRVIKVFFQPNLAEMIKEAEESCEISLSSSRTVNLRTSLLSPRHSINQNKNSLLECEANDFVFIPLFSLQTKTEIKEFIRTLCITRNSITRLSSSIKTSKSDQNFSFKNLFKSFATQEDYQEVEEKIEIDDKLKTKNYLGIILERLVSIFELDETTLFEDSSFQNHDEMSLRSRLLPSGDNSNIYNTSIKSPISSPGERNEIKIFNSALKGKIEYQGNPDFQPIRSYEIEVLVKLFQFISQIVNNRYSSTFKNFYSRRDFFGALSRQILQPPTFFTEIEKQSVLLPPRRKLIELGPRLSLRKLSSKALYSYLFIFYLIFYLLGFSKWTFIIIINLGVLFYFVLKALISFKIRE